MADKRSKVPGMATDIWMKIDISDCAKRRCPYHALSSFGHSADDICTADSERKCPEVRRQLWTMRQDISDYYLKPYV